MASRATAYFAGIATVVAATGIGFGGALFLMETNGPEKIPSKYAQPAVSHVPAPSAAVTNQPAPSASASDPIAQTQPADVKQEETVPGMTEMRLLVLALTGAEAIE